MNNDSTNSGSTFDSVKKKSLKAAGYAYLIGDAAIIAAGMTDPNKKTWGEKSRHALVGGYWALGGLAAARYGNPSAEKELSLLSHRLGNYLKKNHISIPDAPNTEELAQSGGVIDHVQDFLYRHPSQILNAIYAMGAGQLIYSGIRDMHAAGNKSALTLAKLDATSGGLIAAGALAGLLIKEKKADPTHPAHGAWQKALSWVQEKPLRVSGLLYHANNVSMVAATYFKHRSNPDSKNYLWRMLTAASYIFANTMLSISSKHSGTATTDEEDAKNREALSKSAAAVIAAQPRELQQALLLQISSYLSAQPEINRSPEEIAAQLSAKLAEMHPEKPAAEVISGWQQRIQTPSLDLTPAR